jgi:succinate dehydrogenase / fumarate reductase cytochrome b subunit
VLIDDFGLHRLKDQVKRPLRDLSIAPFYGCHIVRPADVLGYDDPNDPRSMHDLIAALSGLPVDFDGKSKCCGFHMMTIDEDRAARHAGELLVDAKDQGADVMVTACPLCHLLMDSWQPKSERVLNRRIHMPVIHVSQMVGLSLGFSAREMGLNRHIIRPLDILNNYTA